MVLQGASSEFKMGIVGQMVDTDARNFLISFRLRVWSLGVCYMELYGYVKTTCWKGSFNQQALPAALFFTWSTARPVSHIMAAHQHHLVHGCGCWRILTVIRRLSYWSAFTRREYVEDQIVLLFSWWTKLPTSNLKDFNHTKWLARRSISVSAKALTNGLFKF